MSTKLNVFFSSTNKMRHRFPPNDKNHQMNTRNAEHIKVFLAHTERVKNSTIIYIQNQLNTEVKKKIKERKIFNH